MLADRDFEIIEERVSRQFSDRAKLSKQLLTNAQRIIPGGVSANIKFFSPNPLFMKKAAGAKIYDVDGHEYTDYLMCYEAQILGHSHPAMREAISKVFQDYGTSAFGTPTQLEAEYGRTLLDLYNQNGMIRFTNSGLEATLLAVRLAKAFTGKLKIGKFEGHYHGSNDHLLVSYRPNVSDAGNASRPLGRPDSKDVDESVLAKTVVLPFNEWESTERLIVENHRELACVILEPFEEGYIPGDQRFMKSLRALTQDLEIPLIFDEIKTGFRIKLGGAAEFYSITPDVTCLGKIIGGGFPIGAVIGREEIMKTLDPSSSDKMRVFHSGTFNGNPISLGTGKAVVETLQENKNFQQIVDKTNLMKEGFEKRLSRTGLHHKMLGEGGLFSFAFTEDEVKNYRDLQKSDLKLRRILDLMLILRGTYVKPMERFSLALAHTEEHILQTLQALDAALDELLSSHDSLEVKDSFHKLASKP